MRTRILVLATVAALGGTLLVPTSADAAQATLTGHVTGAGHPLAVSVRWLSTSWNPQDGAPDAAHGGSTTSNSKDGSYSLSIPAAAGPYYITANIDPSSRSRDYSAFVSEYIGAGGAHDELPDTIAPYAAPATGALDIALPETGAITGTIPELANETVYLTTVLGEPSDDDLGYGGGIASAQVDTHGRFSFPELVPGHFRVVASPSSSYDFPGTAPRSFLPYRSGVLTVASASTTDFSDHAVIGGSISGTVTWHGKPVAHLVVGAIKASSTGAKGATLSFVTSDSTGTQTDAKGRFTIRSLAAGRYWVTVDDFPFGLTSGPGWTQRATRSVSVATAATSHVALTVSKTGALAGRVDTKGVLAYGGPIQVTVRGPHGFVDAYFAGSKDAHGYLLRDLPAGRYTISALDAAHRRWGSVRAVVKLGSTTRVPLIRLSRPTATLSGRVVGATRGTVSVMSSVSGASGRVTSTGHYTVHGILPGRVRVRFDDGGAHAGSLSGAFTIRASVTKKLRAGAVVTKGVILASVTTGHRVPDFCSASLQSRTSYAGAGLTDGRLRLSAPAGRYTLTIDCGGADYAQPGAPFALAPIVRTVVVQAGRKLELGRLVVPIVR